MRRFLFCLIVIALALALNYAREVQAFSLGGEGKTFGKLGRVIMKKGAGVAPSPSGKILLIDASSFLLKVDGMSKICRAGGC